MKVVILGAGRVGYSIARYLAYEEYSHYDITVVDNDLKTLEKTAEKLDIQPVFGHASYPEILKQAGVEDAELLIAVTACDEVNIVACEVAHALFNVPTKIARVRSASYLNEQWIHLFHNRNVAVDRIISPEVEIARSLSQNQEVVGAFRVIGLCQNRIKIIGVKAKEGALILNTPIRLLATVVPQVDMVFLSIKRAETLFFPGGHDMIREGDEVYIATRHEDVLLCMESFGHYDHQQRNIILVGGGNIGYTFAIDMEKIDNMNVQLVEKDPIRCEFLAKNLKKTEVFNGDALDTELLNSLNFTDCEEVITLTNDDKVNILSGLLMKRQGAKRCSTLLNQDQYTSLVSSLGIDATISPKTVTVSTILQSIRFGKVETVHTLDDGETEIIEAKVRTTSHIIGLSIEDVMIENEIRVIALQRQEDIIFNPQKMIISMDDILVMIMRKEAVPRIERLFSIRPGYF